MSITKKSMLSPVSKTSLALVLLGLEEWLLLLSFSVCEQVCFLNKASQWMRALHFTVGARSEPICWKGATSFWKNWLKILTQI